MSEPLDRDDAYWAALRESPVFPRAWNAALWEAAKLVDDPDMSRPDILEALRHMTLRGAEK